MGTRELQEKYAASNGKQAMNRAIRAEIPGGDEALDGRERVYLAHKANPTKEAGIALAEFHEVVAAMEAEIRRRYDMPAADGTRGQGDAETE